MQSSKLKVFFDDKPLKTGHAVRGIGSYTRNLLSALKKRKDVKLVGENPDLVHTPYFDLFFNTLKLHEAPTVVTIYDVIPLIYLHKYPPGIKGKFNLLRQKRKLKEVAAVITISETSRKDIVRFLDVPQEKIYPIHLAPHKRFRRLSPNSTLLHRSVEKYNLPERFVLYVGDVNYNKNIPGLIKACKVAKLPLVICGKQALDIEDEGLGLPSVEGPRDWIRFLFDIPHPELAHYGSLLDYFRNDKKIKILRLGFVPDEDLVAIYNLATVYCQPSFYEGFGLPVLEAMACGTPVVASKTQSLVEIAEGAALFVDPKEVRDIAEGLKKVLEDKELSERLRGSGLENIARFSWQRTADETIKVYKEIL